MGRAVAKPIIANAMGFTAFYPSYALLYLQIALCRVILVYLNIHESARQA